MPSKFQKRDIADFFKPLARDTSSTIPRKRPAQSTQEEDEDEDTIVVNTGPFVPKTPSKSVSFKNVTSTSKSNGQLTFSSVPEASLPIRSPRPNRTQAPVSTRSRASIRASSPPKRTRPTENKSNSSFTFSDVSERSQNVLKAGVLVAVRDSDEDSDDSLESLSEIFKRSKKATPKKASAASPTEDGDLEAERIRALSKFTHGRSVPIVGKDKLRALYAKERASKFDLSKVLDDHFGDEDTAEIVKKARQSSSDEDEWTESAEVDRDLLESIVRHADEEADSDDISRLLSAVERTEALAGEKTYSFFSSQRTGKEMDEEMDDDFPEAVILYDLWDPGDSEGCSRAYLSGFMAEAAGRGKLPDEALRWTFNQVTREAQDDLRQAYVQTLQAGKEYWTRVNLTTSDIQTVFHTLGGHADAIRDNGMIKPRHQSTRSGPKRDLKHLISSLDMFMALCSDMDMLTLSKLSSIAIRLALDTATMSDHCLCFAVENLISTLLNIPDEESASYVYNRILTDAINHLHDPKLQAPLLSHIPPTNPRASRLRKTLADVFLLGPSTIDSKSNTSNATFTDLAKHISTSPSFSLTRKQTTTAVDYTSLTALISILDVAIGSGNPPSPSDPNQPPSMSIKNFNSNLDMLADQIHSLFVSIKDTGASHMRRTEAKDALQALHFRLLYSVRMGQRKKKHIFDVERSVSGEEKWVGRDGDVVREERRGGEFMKKFLAKQA